MNFISGRFLKTGRINFYNFIFVLHIRKMGGGGSPGGIPYLRSIPVGLEGVMQSMLTSFRRHWSMSTELKKATDCGRSCIPNACAKILLQETEADDYS